MDITPKQLYALIAAIVLGTWAGIIFGLITVKLMGWIIG